MYEEHPVFEKPDDENVRIWRYFDFTKFVSLLDRQALFFARADRLSDPFEGSDSKPTVIGRPRALELAGIPKADILKVASWLGRFNRDIRAFILVNSWHMNDHESAAMWRLYLKSDEGVAVRSTFKRLAESFANSPDVVFIGKVKYIDYDTEPIPQDNLFYRCLHKRKSFEYEHELRAITVKLATKGQEIDFTKELSDDECYVIVDLNVLIERVLVSPTAPKWFHQLVKSIVDKYDLHKEVGQSILAEEPLY
jgi:hypothetical protein